jgi:hypothetical protein
VRGIADGVPVAFLGAKNPAELRRLSPSDPSLAEDHIQNVVFDHPSVLPIEELDPTFAPAIQIGRETATLVGAIDALFVSPDGGVTIVEAELWHPQARREVVDQIIDYATELSSWPYEQLDEVCERATGESLWSRVSAHTDDASGEAAFIRRPPTRRVRHPPRHRGANRGAWHPSNRRVRRVRRRRDGQRAWHATPGCSG